MNYNREEIEGSLRKSIFSLERQNRQVKGKGIKRCYSKIAELELISFNEGKIKAFKEVLEML